MKKKFSNRNNNAKAHVKVAAAIKRGALPKLNGTVRCVDCGRPAQQYDHRDYSKPLDVEPVCRSCNRLRGAARNLGILDTVTVHISRSAYRQLHAYLRRRNLVRNARHFLDEAIRLYITHLETVRAGSPNDKRPRT